jgi:S1-C subfamily serine protease
MDDTQISTVEDICTVMDLKQIGDSVRFEVERDGELRQLNVMLEELPPGASSIC